MPSLDTLRQALRSAEDQEHAAQRALSEVLERLEKMRQLIQHNGAVRRDANDAATLEEVRRRLEELERERADLVQEKVRWTETLEKARRRERETRKAVHDAEIRVAKLRAQLPMQERQLARHRQAVAETEYELERRRGVLRDAERTIEALERELRDITGE